MLSLKTAQERYDAADQALKDAHAAAIAADQAVDDARRAFREAEDKLHKARWGSVPCPVCGAKRGQDCRLERDIVPVPGRAPGILHTQRVVASQAVAP